MPYERRTNNMDIPKVGEIGYTSIYPFRVIEHKDNLLRIEVLKRNTHEIVETLEFIDDEINEFKEQLHSYWVTRNQKEKSGSNRGDKIYLGQDFVCSNCKKQIYCAEKCPHCGNIICPVCGKCGCSRDIEYGRGISRGLGY